MKSKADKVESKKEPPKKEKKSLALSADKRVLTAEGIKRKKAK